MNIYLKYGIYTGTTISWTTLGPVNALQCLEIPETTREADRSLRQIEYSHTLSGRSTWNIIISSDILFETTNFDFFKAFYKADLWALSFDNFSTETEVVISETDLMPIEFIQNNKYLPEFSFNLIQKNPD